MLGWVTGSDRFVFVLAANSLPQHILLEGFFSAKGIEVLTPGGYLVLNCKGAYRGRQRRHLTPNSKLSSVSTQLLINCFIDHVSYIWYLSREQTTTSFILLPLNEFLFCFFSTGCEEKKPPTCLSECRFSIINYWFLMLEKELKSFSATKICVFL